MTNPAFLLHPKKVYTMHMIPDPIRDACQLIYMNMMNGFRWCILNYPPIYFKKQNYLFSELFIFACIDQEVFASVASRNL